MPLLTPAEYVIRVFGGVTPLAKALGVAASAVCRWQGRRRGVAGLIPSGAQRRVLDAAAKRNLPVTAEDLVMGRVVPDQG